MATFWPKHGPTGLNFDDFFDYFVFCVGLADEAEPCKSAGSLREPGVFKKISEKLRKLNFSVNYRN